ncbi:MAG: chemotaxis protein CheW [Pseudomonadota bacterium]
MTSLEERTAQAVSDTNLDGGHGSPSRSVPVAAPSRSEAAINVRQFVTFNVSGETFAVALTDVQEIIRLPELITVPLSPPSLAGIVNLRGAVLPIASLRRIFGLEDAPADDASRVVVVHDGVPVGFIVDRVARVVAVDEEDIEEPRGISPSIPQDMVSGIIKIDGEVVMIVSPRRLIAAEFQSHPPHVRAALAGSVPVTAHDQSLQDPVVHDQVQLVSFVVDQQEYAFPIELVQEIVTVPERISHVPNTPEALIGVITLRRRLLALVSLRVLFGLPNADAAESNRIVVVSMNDKNGTPISLGIVTDTVKEVLRIQRSAIDEVPPAINEGLERDDIEGICRLQNGQRLVSIIHAEHLLRTIAGTLPAATYTADRPALAVPQPDHPPLDDSTQQGHIPMLLSPEGPSASKDRADEEELFVVFKLDGGEYGVPIDAVQEIVRVPEELTAVPRTPSFIKGVVNLRGAVLPVVDKRGRLGLDSLPRNDRQRIMVLILNGRKTGFIVDSVSEVLRIATARISAAPNLSEEQARLINRVANIEEDKRVILLIEVSRLLKEEDIKSISEAA